MIVTQKIHIDLLRPGIEPQIHAAKDDKYSRNIKIHIFAAGVPWIIPEDASVLVRYRKPDGTGGLYDTLPDGNKASSMERNELTIVLAPQVLTVAGPVSLTVTMIEGKQQLTTFLLWLQVHPDASADAEDSVEYINVTGFLPAPKSAKPGQYFRVVAVDENGKVTEVESVDGTGGGNVDLTGYATEQFVREGFQPKGDYLTEVPEGYARTEDIPTKPEDIGALPDTYIPPDQTAQQVGADPKGTAAAAVSQHNTAEDSHNDIRLELKALSDRLTAFFDSDDATLDELSEIVAYITGNKSLIESITTSKVSVADIVNDLTTSVSNKPLSAAQGVVLKGLIDGLSTGKLDASALQSAVDGALAKAKANGEFDGKDGADGYTPVKGKDYFDGKDGADGKSAYAYAREGGYTGTEADFAAKLAEEIPDALPNPKHLTFADGLSANNADYYDGSQEKNLFLRKVIYIQITQNEDGSWSASEEFRAIAELIGMGWPVCCIVDGVVCTLMQFDDTCLVFAITLAFGDSFQTYVVSITSDNSVEVGFAETTALPNPNALTINGVSYDGSEAKDITDTIDAMIDAKLGVIENGAY